MFDKSALCAAVLSALTVAPTLVQAAEPDQVVAKVAINDLDLSSDAGRALLHRRIVMSAEQVCGGEPLGSRDLQQIQQFRVCRDQAIQNAAPFATMAIDAASQARAAANASVASRNIKG